MFVILPPEIAPHNLILIFMENRVTIEFYNKRTRRLEKTDFSQSDWENIKRCCGLAGVPLNCRIL